MKKKNRPLKVYHDAVGFFVLRKNRRVPIANIGATHDEIPKITKNKLQSQVIVNNILQRGRRPSKKGSPRPIGPPQVQKVSDSDNFIRHSLVNQLEQLRHLQRNPPQAVPQPITVNNNIPVPLAAPANVNIHPANVTVNTGAPQLEQHDPQMVHESPIRAPPSPQITGEASNILQRLFYSRDDLNALLNYGDIGISTNAATDRIKLLRHFPGLVQILTNTPHRTEGEKRQLADAVRRYVQENKGGRSSSGTKAGRGIYDTEINHIMGKYAPVFQGTIMRDQINKLKPAHKMAFIMNTDTSDKPGEHWVACYLDADHDKSLEYYDSFGKDPPKGFDKDMKKIVDKLKLPHLLKYKINRIVEQKTGDNCGFHSMRFLVNRIKGNKFTEATKYNVLDAEKKAEAMKHKFGFI